MKKMVVFAISAAGILASCDRAPVFPDILMTYRDLDWLKANEDQIPVIVAECDKIMNSELKQSDLPIPVARNCGGIQSKISSIKYSRDRDEQRARARAAAGM
ncbi:hypothetical protein OVY48_06895 [Sphingobium sp. SA2]|uniref:hypothetical protein n=1 Tax=Sphingobium sp. SA2 TaxID=1524832 RepID=UPI0028BF62B9|nr:hypothetical protein [Sphingobium sp. SA2]MDT7533161.1 hypothetical protein [Sphingobium sp. SA2]